MEHKKLKLSQEMNAKKVLEWFRMIDCRLTTSPVTHSATLEAHKGPAADFLYSQAVGLVMYLTMGTRQNLAFNVGLILCFASNPGEVHIKVVKKILPYLKAMTDIGLTFGGSGNQQLVGYADANYTSCTWTRCLTSTYVFLYNQAVLE